MSSEFWLNQNMPFLSLQPTIASVVSAILRGGWAGIEKSYDGGGCESALGCPLDTKALEE